jgi:predicted dehydrogenase
MKIRFGIIGLGIMGKSSGQVLERNTNVELIAGADLNEKTLKDASDKLNIPKRYKKYEDMLKKERLDAVYIATPDWSHYKPIVDSLKAGKHVAVEKPLTTDINEASDIVKMVEKTGLKFQVSFNHRWLSPYHETWRMIKEGKVGQPIVGYARKNNPIFVPTEMLYWAGRSTPAWFLSSHDIDLMSWWFNSTPIEAHAYGTKKVLVAKGIDTYDAIQAQVKYENGSYATFEAVWIYPNTHPAMPDSFMEVIGTEGHIHLDRKAEAIEMSTKKGLEWPRSFLNCEVFGEWQGAFPSCINSFVKDIIEDRKPIVNAREGWRTTAALDAIHRSIISGKVEKVCIAPF